jgi:hypothetical protein
MSAYWFFSTHGDTVYMLARFESDDGIIGDASHKVLPGEEFYGIPYAALKAARGGRVQMISASKAKIVTEGD